MMATGKQVEFAKNIHAAGSDLPGMINDILDLVHDGGFKGIVTQQGNTVASLARRYSPKAILLDVGLPDMASAPTAPRAADLEASSA